LNGEQIKMVGEARIARVILKRKKQVDTSARQGERYKNGENVLGVCSRFNAPLINRQFAPQTITTFYVHINSVSLTKIVTLFFPLIVELSCEMLICRIKITLSVFSVVYFILMYLARFCKNCI